MKIKFASLVAALLMPQMADAVTVYRYTTEAGTVVFSDRPADKSSQKIELPDPKPLPKSPQKPQGQEKAKAESQKVKEKPELDYTAFEVVSPTEGENVRNNEGRADVRLRLTPSLQLGHYIMVQVDGQTLPNKLKSTGLRLNDMPRGQHTVQAIVYDRSGKELKRTKMVQFMMRRQSVITRSNLGLGG